MTPLEKDRLKRHQHQLKTADGNKYTILPSGSSESVTHCLAQIGRDQTAPTSQEGQRERKTCSSHSEQCVFMCVYVCMYVRG